MKFVLTTMISLFGFPSVKAAYSAFADGAKGLYAGHSFFVPVAKSFDTFAQGNADAFPSHATEFVFSSGPTGGPYQLWSDPEKKNRIESFLSEGDVDIFGLTVVTDSEENMQAYFDFFDLAIKYNPNTVILVGLPWPPGGPKMTAERFQNVADQASQACREIVESLRTAYPNNQVLFVDYGQTAAKMLTMFEDGNLPDITKKSPSFRNQMEVEETFLFADSSIGHAGPMMTQMSALAWMEILYGVDLDALITEAEGDWDSDSVDEILSASSAINQDNNLF